ncbi:MAG: hypothetical protein V4598_05325 [Bdellovibrionota bacterium]
MKFFLLASLFVTSIAQANDPRCVTRLNDLIGGNATLLETGASDGKPLTITLSNFNPSSATVSSNGTKGGKTFGMVSGQFSVSNCQMLSAGVKFKMSANGKSLTITQNGSVIKASAGILWSGEFVLR